jgi:hypothetical protein
MCFVGLWVIVGIILQSIFNFIKLDLKQKNCDIFMRNQKGAFIFTASTSVSEHTALFNHINFTMNLTAYEPILNCTFKALPTGLPVVSCFTNDIGGFCPGQRRRTGR